MLQRIQRNVVSKDLVAMREAFVRVNVPACGRKALQQLGFEKMKQ